MAALILVGVALSFLAGVAIADKATPPPRISQEPQEVYQHSFREGKLIGWYVYLYARGERFVCANPTVWTGPQIVTCTHLVQVDELPAPGATPEAPDTPPADPLGMDLPELYPRFDYPPGEDPYAEMVREDIDRIHRRLTWEGRKEERERRPKR